MNRGAPCLTWRWLVSARSVYALCPGAGIRVAGDWTARPFPPNLARLDQAERIDLNLQLAQAVCVYRRFA